MKDQIQQVKAALEEARSGLNNLIANEEALERVAQAANLMIASLKNGGKVMSCGNGPKT